MKNWRELGEVPDSDDESFGNLDDDVDLDELDPLSQHVDPGDSDDPLPKHTYPEDPNETRTEHVHSKPLPDEDIWSVPSSSPENLLSQQPVTPEKKPPGTAGNSFLEDEISTGYVQVAALPSLLSSPASLLSRTPSLPPSPPAARITPSPRPNRETPSNDEEELSRQADVQLERSLRPRKPIQQHPYLLEKAQYVKSMKSHGVKPIQIAQPSQSEHRGDEDEDSQDAEFQAEESQEASAERLLDGLEDSGPIFFDNDEDELALSPKTSSPGHHLRTSSQQTSAGQTDATSISDEELPPIGKLWPASAKKRQQPLKRQRPKQLSFAKRKRARIVLDSSQGSPRLPTFIPPPDDPWDLSPSPPEPQIRQDASQEFGSTRESPPRERPSTPQASMQRPETNTNQADNRAAASPIVIDEDNQSELSDDDLTSFTHSSDSDSDVVRKVSRRIRGVLPASWLRLDRQPDKPAARNTTRRSPEPSPPRTIRRGVALPRQGFPKPSSTVPLVVFNDSDEESDDTSMIPGRTTAHGPVQAAPPPTIIINDDDGASDMEDDSIDWMLPGRKRSASQTASGRPKRRRQGPAQTVFRGLPGQSLRQPKITQALNLSKRPTDSSSRKRSSGGRHHGGRDRTSTTRKPRKRATTPPLLSILDVVEPDAPKFIKIAARAVKRKPNLGKSSPSRKVISLATRSDNVDALSVLRDWKSGKTKPRIPALPSRPSQKSRARPALREVSNNVPRPRHTHPQKLVRQSSLDAFVAVDDDRDSASEKTPSTSRVPSRKPLQPRVPSFQPAQLETEEQEDTRRRLHARKRTLDTFYRRNRGHLGVSIEDSVLPQLDPDFTLRQPPADEEDDFVVGTEEPLPTRGKKGNAKSRFRKRHHPQQADLEAPHYARANDPLPAEIYASEVHEVQEHHSQDKLKGLGPYGMHYTHHFEVFPLHTGTFFHESTVIGRGCVRDAVDAGLVDRIHHQKPAVSFSLDGKTLRWGAWNDNTSSELGILVDWISEQSGSDAAREAVGPKAVEAADFILKYILGSLSFQGEVEEKAFFSRAIEVFSSFISRFDTVDWPALQEAAKKTHLEVAVRFSVAILAVRSLSNASDGDFMQTMKVEDLLKKCASVTIDRLLECGTEELRTLYGDLQRCSFRERGIRSDSTLTNCWMVIIRVLESAAIPRSASWDVTQSVMLGKGAAAKGDVQVFEQLWQDMFTLLPLCEIDNSGILIPGMRRSAPVEGWVLPQQLLKGVFELYRSNPRQPPGFNDYCRALVARCHFLVQEWGWRKCTGIIGIIFDFFGSQNLAHLRNEEANKSPQFLEELHNNPLRSIERIEREDRCFHIFIKLLALTIWRLRELGRAKDIKNLVARTLPNHNRQYLKEDTVRQHDLAALRNHHDLLCTLFWISPPEMRPAVHLIEKLVIPASAHKEACLINVRAWNQLARFVIASGEGAGAFKPLAAWRNNVFNQVLDQYLSAASDIEQQFRAMASDMPRISKDVRDEMVAKNKATALDVLHFSAKASLDVLKRAPNLQEALYGLNTTQLQKVFTSLDFHGPGFDWSVFRVALDTLEHFVDRIEKTAEEQYSSEFSDNADAASLEEAVLLLNERLTKDFFWMCRTTLALPLEKPLGQHKEQAACAEKTVTLAARIAARFIKNRVTQLSPFFSTGKYGLFSDLPKSLSAPERRYLPLFLAVLVKNQIFDFKDLGTSILGLWILSIVKPMRFLQYENYLADVLKHHGLPFLGRATVTIGIRPDYNSNIDFFACALHHMRKTLRETNSIQSRHHRDEFSTILRLAMAKIKDDLVLLRTIDSSEHALYIPFVRNSISLIKSHAVGICPVDPFFTAPSPNYLPPAQDPQLHAAGIVAYGVRLAERDVRAAPELFHYLYNSFKIALDNDRLGTECRILARAARENGQVVRFVLGVMMPAAVEACKAVCGCWPLVEVYAVALGEVLDGGEGGEGVSRELVEREDVEAAVGVLRGVVGWFESGGDTSSGAGDTSSSAGLLTGSMPPRLHVMALLVGVANFLRPSVVGYLINNSGDDDDEAESAAGISGLKEVLGQLTYLFSQVRLHLDGRIGLSESQPSQQAIVTVARTLLAGLSPWSPSDAVTAGLGTDARVQDFAKTIALDVQRNWVITGDRVRAGAGPGRGAGAGGVPSMTQAASSAQGARYSWLDMREVLRRLWVEVRRWEVGMGVEESRDGNGSRRGVVMEEELLF